MSFIQNLRSQQRPNTVAPVVPTVSGEPSGLAATTQLPNRFNGRFSNQIAQVGRPTLGAAQRPLTNYRG